MKKLSINIAEKLRANHAPDWEMVEGTVLQKRATVADYPAVLKFLMDIYKPQVELDHFIDFKFFYNEMTIKITTHDVNGLTILDFQLALHINKALERLQADESLP